MKSLILPLILLATVRTFAQDTISTKQVNQYMDKDVILKGRIINIKDYQTSKGDKMVFIDIDEKYPSNPISIKIFEEVLLQLKPSIYSFLNKQVYIKGKITTYRNNPSLELKNPKFIMLL